MTCPGNFVKDELISLAGGGDVVAGDLLRELGIDGLDHRLQADDSGGGGESGQQGNIGHWPADVLATEIGGRDGEQPVCRPVTDKIGKAQLGKAATGIDQDIAAFLQAGEDIHLEEQGRILNDQAIARC